ncbi:alkaline phosphatase family protein [Stieleria sp. TO1_6]|uniref:alkaline phosphatase family protein n=1 Tax=Stieleria tagensis TaxID=2956795 RepID=UPI00209B806E|nr:alkaline phosphatase family protein [Stieleria tagensis]MCO8125513.1 alkaline phosphatase family protein [Stieleria tagensis]
MFCFLDHCHGKCANLVCIVAIGLLSLACVSADEPSQVPTKHVLVIGIDGTRADALNAADTPHLDALIKRGRLWENTQILGDRPTENDTVSGPGWSSFLTGVWADKHGVQDNRFAGNQLDQFPHFFSYIRQRYPAARLGSFVDWAPIQQYIVRDADVDVCFESHGAGEYAKSDKKLADAAAAFLRQPESDVAMVYFGAADETGHANGFHPSIKAYTDSIATIDQRVGEVVAAMLSRENYESEDWLVIVSTDHGGRGTGHGGGHEVPEIRQTWMIVSGSAVVVKPNDIEPTYVVDVATTALKHLGIDLDPAWQLDGKAVGIKP